VRSMTHKVSESRANRKNHCWGQFLLQRRKSVGPRCSLGFPMPGLGKREVMRIRGHSAAHQTRLPQYELAVLLITQANRLTQRSYHPAADYFLAALKTFLLRATWGPTRCAAAQTTELEGGFVRSYVHDATERLEYPPGRCRFQAVGIWMEGRVRGM
jgi:hypothetical protein